MNEDPGIEELINLGEYEEIYGIYGPKLYVGRHKMTDKQGLLRTKEDRFEEHKSRARENTEMGGCRRLMEAFREHGEAAFKIVHLEFCKAEEAQRREIHWIKQLDVVYPHGYNLTSGNDDGSYSMHPESRQRCSDALKSLGKLGRRNPFAKVLLIRAPNHVGYRGYYKGEPHGFFSNNFTLAEKRDMALAWHLYGELQYERRLPRQRIHTDKEGNGITQPGVKVRFNTAGGKVYHAYHPARPDIKEKSFTVLDEAVEYAKKLIDFGDNIPDEYFVVKRTPRPTDVDLRYIRIKRANGRNRVPKGTDVGHEVSIPANLSKTGRRMGKCFSSHKANLVETADLALRWRDEHLKAPLPPLSNLLVSSSFS